MTIYTHNGVYYDLPTDDPELAKQKIMAHVGANPNSQPKTVADLQKQQLATVGDTVANAVTGTLDMLAYPIARQYYERIGGMSKEDAAARAVKETSSIKDPFGTHFGYKGQATYENAPQRKIGEFIGEGIQEGVVKPITEQSGLIESDVANMVNLGMMAGGAVSPKIIAPIKAAGGAVGEVASGFGGRLGTRPGIAKPGAEPKVYQKPSALEPAGKEYLPPEIKQQLETGVITPEQANQQFKAWNAEQIQALQQTKGMVPLANQKWQGVGEMLAEPYTSPKGWLPDIGLAALGYGVGAMTGAGPLMAGLPPLLNLARKGYQAVNAGKTIGAADTLHNAGFTRMTPEMRAQLAQARVAGAVPPTPQTMAAAQINPAMATTPAAQAAVNTTQAKAQKSQWGASGNYDVNTGKGSVRINTPLGPMTVRFDKNGRPIVEPIVEPQTAPPVQTTGAVEPLPPSRQLGYTPPTMYVAPEGVAGTNLRQVEQTALQQRYAPQPVTGAPQPEVVAPPVKTTKEDILARLSAAKNAEPVYKDAGEMRKALTGKVTPDVMEKLVREKFPAVETPGPKVITAEQQAKRDDFMNNRIPERVTGMEQGRAANKETYADKAEAMRKMAADNKARGKKDFPMYGRYSEGQNMNPKDVFTERKAVADMVNQVSQGNVTSKNKNIVVRRQGYDQMADGIGITLDWNTAPKPGKTIAETRKVMDKWMMDSINKELPELGLYKRKESFTQQQKRLEREAAENPPPPLTAEEQAKLDAIPTRTMDSDSRLKSLLNKGESPKPSTPKTSTPIETEAARPEGVPEPAKLTKDQLLEMIKNRGKGNPPSGTSQLMTQNAPLEMVYTSGKKGQQAIQNAPWLDKADYDTAIFNRSIGFDKNNQFIAKTRTENGGSIVTAADKKSSTEAVQFPDKSEVMIIKDLQNEGSYTVDIKSYGINKKYTFDIPYGLHGRSQKLASEPMNVEIYDIPAVGNKRGQLLASWEADSDWTIVQKNKDGSYQTVPWYEIEKTKNHPLKEQLDGLRKETGLNRHEDNGFNDAQVSSDIQYWENKIKELKEGK